MKSAVTQSRKTPMGHSRAWHKMPLLTLSLTLFSGLGLMHGSTNASADEVRLPIAENVRQGNRLMVPHKGESPATVESRFGAPERRDGPVGSPAISRWHYPGFVVYFENDHVIHSVAKP